MITSATVPSKYRHFTRLGNWSQEWELEEVRKKQYLRRKANKTFPSQKLQQALLKSFQPASLTFSKDGQLRFGSSFMLYNAKTQGFLAADTFKSIQNTAQHFNASTVMGLHACLRSVFTIERANPKDGFHDDLVHYGQEFKIRVHTMLSSKEKPLYLHSEHQNDRKFSQKTRMQEVTWALKDTYDKYNVVWSFEDPDYENRLETEGQVVKVTDNVILKHNFTNRWLASDVVEYSNFFGEEFEVMVNNFFLNSKAQVLKNEHEGKTTIDFAQRGQKLENVWVLVCAKHPSQEFDQSVIRKVDSLPTILQKVKFHLGQRGIYGLRFLSKVFKNMDIDKIKTLDPQDFMWGLKSAKVFFDYDQFQTVLKHYGPEALDYSRFVCDLRGSLSDIRRQMILKAYEIICKRVGSEDRITVEEMGKIFDSKRHPEVLKGKRSEQKVFNEFVAHWNRVQPDIKVGKEQFLEYYWDISATIPKDDHFEFLLVSIWHP